MCEHTGKVGSRRVMKGNYLHRDLPRSGASNIQACAVLIRDLSIGAVGPEVAAGSRSPLSTNPVVRRHADSGHYASE